MTTPDPAASPPPPLDAFEVAFARPEHGWLDFTAAPLTGDGIVSATNLADPFPGMIAWLEAIARGANTARWLIDEERQTCAQFVFTASRHLFLTGTTGHLIFLRSCSVGRTSDLASCPVTPMGVVRRFYCGFRNYVGSETYDPSHWEDDGDTDRDPSLPGRLRLLRSPLLEAALAGQPGEEVA